MTKLIPLKRAAATVAALLLACLLACAVPAASLAAGAQPGGEPATSTTGGTVAHTRAPSKAPHKAAAHAAHGKGKSHRSSKEGLGEQTPLNLGSSSTGTTHTSGGGASIVRTIVGLAIVIAVIWGLSWILRQVKSGREPNAPSEGLTSVAALTLGSGRTVHLVKAGSEYVLLAAAEHGMVPIHRYSEQEASAAGLVPAEMPAAGRGGRGRAQGNGHDPMRMPAPGVGVVERLREWTVRR